MPIRKYSTDEAEKFKKYYGRYPRGYEPKAKTLTEEGKRQKRLETQKFVAPELKERQYPGSTTATVDSVKAGLKPSAYQEYQRKKEGTVSEKQQALNRLVGVGNIQQAEADSITAGIKKFATPKAPGADFGIPPWYMNPKFINTEIGRNALNKQIKGKSDEDKLKFWTDMLKMTIDFAGDPLENMTPLYDRSQQEINSLLDKKKKQIQWVR